MSSTTSSLVKPISMANGCFTSHPSLFTAKASYPFLSIPSKPIKFHQLSSSSSWVFPKKKNPSSSIVTLVAQTSDWAQDGENVAVEEGFNLGLSEDEEGTGVEGGAEESEAEEGSGSGDFYAEPPEEAKLFVGNLPFDVDHNQLAEMFNEAGVVETAEVIYNRETGQSRGFGFVVMATVEEAEKAIKMYQGFNVNGRSLTVNKAGPRGTRPERPAREFGPSFRIYVGNLSWQVDDVRLEQVFSEHGKVVDAKVIFDRETGRSRGFGFVTMASEAELNDAIAALDGQNVDGRDIRVNVAEERPRRSF